MDEKMQGVLVRVEELENTMQILLGVVVDTSEIIINIHELMLVARNRYDSAKNDEAGEVLH